MYVNWTRHFLKYIAGKSKCLSDCSSMTAPVPNRACTGTRWPKRQRSCRDAEHGWPASMSEHDDTLLAENRGMQERLMNGYLNGAIPEDTFKTKTAELKDVRLNLEEECANVGRFNPTNNLTAMAAFDFCQRVQELWHGSNYLARREILDIAQRILCSATLPWNGYWPPHWPGLLRSRRGCREPGPDAIRR